MEPQTPASGTPAPAPAAPVAPAAPAKSGTLLTTPPAKPAEGTLNSGKAPEGNADPAGAQPQGDKAGEGKPANAAPEPLTLKLPEGMKADDKLLAGFEPVAKELGLDSGKAQKLVDLYAGRILEVQKEAIEAHQKQVDGWAEQVKTDKELGGDHFAETQQLVASVMTQFNDPGLVEVLNTSGFGNHPALVRFVARIGKAIADDTIKGAGGGGGKAPLTEAEKLARFYDKSQPTKK